MSGSTYDARAKTMIFNNEFDPSDFVVTSDAGDANIEYNKVTIKINGKIVTALRFKSANFSCGISRSNGVKYAASNSMIVSYSPVVEIIKKIDEAVFGQFTKTGYFIKNGEQVKFNPDSRRKVFSSQDADKNDELFMIKFHDEVRDNVVHNIMVVDEGVKSMLYTTDEPLSEPIFKLYMKNQAIAQKKNKYCDYINKVYGTRNSGKITKFDDIAPEKRFSLHDGESFFEAVKGLNFLEFTFGISKPMIAKEHADQLCMSFYFRDAIAEPKSNGGIEDLLNRGDEYVTKTSVDDLPSDDEYAD